MEIPLNIAICEDNSDDLSRILSYIKSSDIPTKCDTFSSGEELLAIFTAGQYDLIFLDIYMEGMRGIDAATHIRTTDTTVILVFTTTSLDHALESYRLKAAQYIEKPVPPEEVREALQAAETKRRSAQYIHLLIAGKNHPIPIDSIIYFEQQNHTVMVNTCFEQLRTSQLMKLNNIEMLLPDTFLRCHHSYIVNLKYIREMDQELKVCTMQNGDKVHIRHSSYKAVVKAYENYLFSTARGGSV